MGVVSTIQHNMFPVQGRLVGQTIEICFHYDTDNSIKGVCVRDDIEEPFKTIFKLDDGRFVLSTECQYTFGGGA